MLLLGDVCIAETDRIFFDKNLEKIFKSNLSICNLEGPINTKRVFNNETYKMYNASHSIEFLKRTNTKVVNLSNNHIFDWGDEAVLDTINYLNKKGINNIGYRLRKNVQMSPVFLNEGIHNYSFYSFGWPIISCKRPTKTRPGINPLDEYDIDYYIKNIIPNIPKNYIKVVYMHWCYEMEPYVQPLHRDFARKLIDNGVQVVTGSHPHVVGPIEKYKQGIIVHSLGNCFYSSGKFCNGNLNYPRESNYQLIIEMKGLKDINIHTIKNDKSLLKVIESSKINTFLENDPINLSKYNSKDYLIFYKKWAQKRSRFLPIFTSNKNIVLEILFKFLIFLRMIMIRLLIFSGLKNAGSRNSQKNLITDSLERKTK